MGLFSDKKKVQVASTLYNMAGDENDRPDFLKGTLFGSVMANSPSIADDIQKGYFYGPGQKQLQFFRWCQQSDFSALPSISVTDTASVDTDVVAGEIPRSPVPPAPEGLILSCYNAFATDGDFEPWIERWVLENHPTRYNEQWLGEYDRINEIFSVEFPNNDFYSWENNIEPVYKKNSQYVIAKYIEYLESSEGPVINLPETTGVLTANLPDVTGWNENVNNPTFTPITLVRRRTTTLSYNNGDPDNVIENNVVADVPDQQLNTTTQQYERSVNVSITGIVSQGLREVWNFQATDFVSDDYTETVVTTTDLGGGVIETRTEVTTGEQINPQWTTQKDEQDLFDGEQYGGEQRFMYEVGTGNATLDALVTDLDASDFQEFFPIMPLRIDNRSVGHPSYESLFDEMSTAYSRAYEGKQFSKLVDSVDENPSIEDIDYAYLIWGVSLNVKENACKLYCYDFFKKLIQFQRTGSSNVMSNLAAEISAYNASLVAIDNWEECNRQDEGGSYRVCGLRPEVPKAPSTPSASTLKLKIGSYGIDYRMSWVHIEEEQFEGTFDMVPAIGGEPAIQSKIKDVRIDVGPSLSYEIRERFTRDEFGEFPTTYNIIPSIYIYRQIDENNYRRLQVWGLVSNNYIYGGKSVEINAYEAINDNEESGFLIPLHYPTMLEMNIIDYTQMCTANAHVMFNSYEVTKQRWYERGIFRILLVIAIIIVAVIVFPGAFAAGGGVLGGNLAVGAALGLTGTAALVAGVVANYIASIIIAELLKLVGTAIFGEKWGAVFAAIASFALGLAISGTSLFSAEGLLGLGNALANGYAGWVQGDIAEMNEDLQDDREDYEDRMEYIQDLIDGLDNGNGLNFDPRFFTRSQRGNGRGGYMPETAEEFIRRTTMTGGDVVELTFGMVYDFPELKRTLPRN